MRQIISEIIIPLHKKEDGILAASQIKIRIDDQGGGPYLVITGINHEPSADETGHEFSLETEEQIDAFAAICKDMLRGAE